MRFLFRRAAALVLAGCLLLGGGAHAVDPVILDPSLRDDPNYSGNTIDIETKFDYIMQFVDWYSLSAEGKDVLRQYFNRYFEEHPEEFVALVNDIMQSMDPHSRYMTAEQYAATFGQTLQDYVGIGITLEGQSGHTLTRVYENGPAYTAGLRPGDTITAVGGMDTAAKTNDELIALLRGEAGTSVNITVSRGGKLMTFTVTRALVTPEHVSGKTLAKGVEYIRIEAMGSQTDTDRFVQLWSALPAKGARAAIIDLRGNGGGLVSMAQTMVETIVPEKDVTYLGLRERKSLGGLQEYVTPGGGVRLNQIVLLVDGGTASAAEIVAGSLRDLGSATLLGTKTYGKGVGQLHMTMPDGSMLILTSLEMQLPKSGVYDGSGLVPDIQLALSATGAGDPAALTPLSADAPLLPGDRGDAVRAMTERLSLLGYLDSAQEGFDAAVLAAVRRFELASGSRPGLFASRDTLRLLDARANEVRQAAQGLDNQLAAALEICKLAAEKPAQYTVNSDGTWTNMAK